MTVRIVIAGVTGRMGREVAAAAAETPDVAVLGGLLRPGSPLAGRDWSSVVGTSAVDATLDGTPARVLPGADVLIDFTTPEATAVMARACAEANVALVSGTTGLSSDHMAELQTAAERVPVFYARNMSLGIATLLEALPAIAQLLVGYDVEIVETHHRHKVDAPSGTALALAEAIAAARDVDLAERASFGRHGVAPRQGGEIGLHAVRAGGNPGEHVVILAGEGEELRLSHRSFSRRAYATGALQAAKFTAGRAPGLYGLRDLMTARG